MCSSDLGRPHELSLYSDVESLNNIYIMSSYADCNNDGLFEYYKFHPNVTEIKETFTCVNNEGVQTHVFGVELYKNHSGKWKGICENFKSNNRICAVNKKFEVFIR